MILAPKKPPILIGNAQKACLGALGQINYYIHHTYTTHT